MYIFNILRLELLLAKADFTKMKKIPSQRGKSRFLHGESKSALLPTFGTSSIATSGTEGPVLFSSCVQRLVHIGTTKKFTGSAKSSFYFLTNLGRLLSEI